MKLSLWHEFSSNNSSSYVVIGTFETPQRAYEAAEIMTSVLQQLWQWYADHPDVREQVLSEEGYELTDAEREIAKDYPIEFEEAVEWVAREESLAFLPNAVTTFENTVFLATVDETVTNDTPFAQLMHHLGAQVKFEEALESYLLVNISAKVPNLLTGTYIEASIETYLEDDGPWHYAPWALFYGGQLVADPEQMNQYIDVYIANRQASMLWYREHDPLIERLRTEREEFQRAGDRDTVEAITAQIRWLYDHRGNIEPSLPNDIYASVHRLMCAACVSDSEETEITFEAETLTITGLNWLDDDLGPGLSAMVTWMRSLGCRDVTYEFVAVKRR